LRVGTQIRARINIQGVYIAVFLAKTVLFNVAVAYLTTCLQLRARPRATQPHDRAAIALKASIKRLLLYFGDVKKLSLSEKLNIQN